MEIYGIILIVLYLVSIGIVLDKNQSIQYMRISAICGWGSSIVLAVFYFFL